MASRRRIGIIYRWDEAWIGGTYYVENILRSFNYLQEEEKPFVVLFCETIEEYEKVKTNTSYKYLEYRSFEVNQNIFKRVVNKISRAILGKTTFYFVHDINQIDFIYPNPKGIMFQHLPMSKRVFWIPDFQDIHLPQFFTDHELVNRKNWYDYLANEGEKLVFSSVDARNDFNKLYPSSTASTCVIPFAVSSLKDEVYSENEVSEVLNRHYIKEDFFLCSNQQWAHKNHEVIFKALKTLKKQENDVTIVLTGKEEDYRNPSFPATLRAMVKEFGITDQVKFLGFISKKDLEVLVQSCQALIQPSLFEGWNTSIEEAKRKQKWIIASSIDVHKEQLNSYEGSFLFEATNAEQLTSILSNFEMKKKRKLNYDKNIVQFAKNILKI